MLISEWPTEEKASSDWIECTETAAAALLNPEF